MYVHIIHDKSTTLCIKYFFLVGARGINPQDQNTAKLKTPREGNPFQISSQRE